MSALSLAAGGIWRTVAIVLDILLLAVASAAGTGWWLADGARDRALRDLAAAQATSAQLSASIDEQNRALDGMATATLAAQQRGDAARALAATRGRQLDAAMTQITGARATTCDEAMPAVRQLLEGVR